MSILRLEKCVLVSRPDIFFVSMEFTLHGAVKLNTITGFSKAADNLLVIKNPSGCAVCLHWSILLVPGHENLGNNNCGLRQRFQTVDPQGWSRTTSVAVCFLYSAILLIHNVDGLVCWVFFYPRWVLKALGFSAVSREPPCFVINNGLLAVVANMVYFVHGFVTCAHPEMCSRVLCQHV